MENEKQTDESLPENFLKIFCILGINFYSAVGYGFTWFYLTDDIVTSVVLGCITGILGNMWLTIWWMKMKYDSGGNE